MFKCELMCLCYHPRRIRACINNCPHVLPFIYDILYLLYPVLITPTTVVYILATIYIHTCTHVGSIVGSFDKAMNIMSIECPMEIYEKWD